jgi:hypothetical protein
VKALESPLHSARRLTYSSDRFQRIGQPFDDIPDGLAFPEATPVVDRSERAALHAVDVERPSQMINLVLEYPSVPSKSFDRLWFSIFI